MDRVYGRLKELAEQVASEQRGRLLPFRRVPPEEARPFVNCVPALDLKVAAGGWSPDQLVEEDRGRYEWVAWAGRTRPGPGLFVAQVVGESMNRRIPDGAWCVWRLDPQGTRQGKVVLARHRAIQDAESGAGYTVKGYESVKEQADDGTEQITRVILRPDSTNPAFQPIVLEGLREGELTIVAELAEVLG